MRTFKTFRDPFGVGFNTTKPKQIEIKDGLTVLVGCNGAGKTTLLTNMEDELKKANIPVFQYSEHFDGRHMKDKAAAKGDMSFVATSVCSSEGENINLNLCKVISQLREFIKEGTFNRSEEVTSTERWILFDAIDSGYSIDNIIELKAIFNLMLEDAKTFGVQLYIIVSANSYELASNENCFDIINGEYVAFNSYEDYKQFILDSRKLKDERYKES